jgi:hypothetical protein
MARVYLINTAFKIAYTNDQSVGTGCQNSRDDVLLVQFFLKVVSEGPEKDKYGVPGKMMTCDGSWGPTSQAFLNKFIAVNSAANPNFPLTQDGRVDPVQGGKVIGSISHNVYTILALNTSYKNVRGVAAMMDITVDASFPATLRPSIKIIQ